MNETSADLRSLEARTNALLPARYQCFSSVSPTSMGSAGLKFGPDSRVAWDQIWTHYCDLALAGGPPHRGTLLEAPLPGEAEAEPAGYQLVVEEIIRGITMTSGLVASPGAEPGWVEVRCQDETMAAWLLRAVTAENVVARRSGDALWLPAGPRFRLTKEVKNVVVALAKCCHYWTDHLSVEEQIAAARVLQDSSPRLLEPATPAEVAARSDGYRDSAARLGQAIEAATGRNPVSGRSAAWVGVRLADLTMAAWFVRAAIAENILARREEEVLYLPVPAPSQPDAPFEVVGRLERLCRLWAAAELDRKASR